MSTETDKAQVRRFYDQVLNGRRVEAIDELAVTGIPPTGRSCAIAGIDIYRLEDGQLAPRPAHRAATPPEPPGCHTAAALDQRAHRDPTLKITQCTYSISPACQINSARGRMSRPVS
jgi:hypothetical protein